MIQAIALLVGIVLAAIVCRWAVRKNDRLGAVLVLAFVGGAACFLIDAQTRNMETVMAQPDEAIGRHHYAAALDCLKAGDPHRAVHEFKLAEPHFEPGSGYGKATRAALIHLSPKGD